MRKRKFGSVVLIDSSRCQLKILKNAFEKQNTTACVCIERATEAAEYLKQADRVDVIVLDWLGMDMDIVDFMDEVRESAACVNSRVILCGPGSTSLNVRESLLSIGVDYYMIKPYRIDTLFYWIDALRPVRHFQMDTVWDAGILRKLEEGGLSRTDVGYWYLGSSLQYWLSSEGPPQLKSIYIQVGRQYKVGFKGVESGVTRAIRTMAAAAGRTGTVRCKEWISGMADSILAEYNEGNRGENHADKEL